MTSPGPESPAQRERRVREADHPLTRILELVRVLRGPGGCPWDRDQTVVSLTPYLQEETYEVVEAVEEGDPAGFREELGDLLFLVLFLAETGAARGWGSLDAVAEAVVEKLVRRHPHVFGESAGLESAGALRQWEELKRDEKETTEASAEEGFVSTLGERPKGLPALTTAFRISEKSGAVGFQWPTAADAYRKLREEVGELGREMETGDEAALRDEMGDVLYAAANLARYLGIDPESALRGTIAKFTRRFHHVERRLREEGSQPSRAGLERMSALWDEAKERE